MFRKVEQYILHAFCNGIYLLLDGAFRISLFTRLKVHYKIIECPLEKITLPINSNNSLLASPRAAGAATVTRTSSAFTPESTNNSVTTLYAPMD